MINFKKQLIKMGYKCDFTGGYCLTLKKVFKNGSSIEISDKESGIEALNKDSYIGVFNTEGEPVFETTLKMLPTLKKWGMV
ncbi:MAG: hypothetical protein HOM01_14865 [Kordiimonadaceae bacterium]|jgi:hypothetical protein|nr:hypothetical protein [Kordiimonadaceae bacterium]